MKLLETPNMIINEALREAVTAAVERSFFTVVEPCDERDLAQFIGDAPGWLVASVHFSEEDAAGSLFCTLRRSSAVELFNSFGGRDPNGPPPSEEDLFDLMGELANMVCGSWLTRLANHQMFKLSRPVVHQAPDSDQLPSADSRILMTMPCGPLIVEVRFAKSDEHQPAPAGA